MKYLMRTVLFVVLLAFCMAFGFFWRDVQHHQAPSRASLDRLLGVKVTGSSVRSEQVFRDNYQRILANSIRPVKAVDLKYAGIGGMMASLGDPHTIFLPPRAAKMFSEETKANFFGVGARLQTDPLGAKVMSVFEDGPAYAAGMRKGNIISGVDGKSVGGMAIDDIVQKIKGKEGTIVRLTVVQPGKQKPVLMSIARARIIAPTVDGSVLPDTNIGYMSIISFSEPTTAQFDRELAKLETQGIKGLVIDLRGNPGGLLETAADMLGRFVSDKQVVTMVFRNGTKEEERTPSGEVHNFKYPIAVLIDQDSASAAEIFSGCLRDYGKATLVGTHSYGKASVQNVFPLIDQSSAKVTIAKYMLPSSGDIGRKVDADGVYIKGGLTPDVQVELNTDVLVTMGEPKTDNQLAKAIQVLKAKM